MKEKSKFYKIYFGILIGFAALLLVSGIYFYGWLKDYENTRPEVVAKGVISKYIENGNAGAMKSDCALDLSDYETEKSVSQAVESFTKTKKITLSTSGKKVKGYDFAYNIKADDKTFLSIYLVKNKDKTFFGHYGYSVKKSAFADSFYKTAVIKLSSDDDITVNGIKLKDNDRTDDTLPKLPESITAKIKNKKQTAKLNRLINPNPEIKAFKNEKAMEIKNNNGIFEVINTYSGVIGDKITDFALEAAKTYAAYMQDDKRFSQVAAYLMPKTEFYQNLKTSLVIFALKHDSYHFENIDTSELYSYSDTLFSVRVKFEQVLKLGKKEYRDNFDKNIFVSFENNILSIIDMQSVGESANE